MFELFLTNTANLDTLRNFWNRGACFAHHVEIRRGEQRIFSEWQKARERAGGGSMMSTSFKTKFCEPTGDNYRIASLADSIVSDNESDMRYKPLPWSTRFEVTPSAKEAIAFTSSSDIGNPAKTSPTRCTDRTKPPSLK